MNVYRTRVIRVGTWVVGIVLGSAMALGQATATADAKPLPQVGALMLQVEANQKAAEAKQKDYLFHETMQVDSLKGDGSVKKSDYEERDVFWLNGVVVRKLVKKDKKELSDDEKKKEDERIDKEVAKAKERKAKADGKGEATDADGHPEITVSRLLELGSFGNERRQVVNGRDTILVDFTGDPKAKTRNPAESAVHEMTGTAWIDEEDTALERVQGQFVNDFKLGGGLLVKVKKGTQFELTNVKVNEEVWLPGQITASGEARALLLFGLDGRFVARYSDYRKFGAKSTILPGFTESPVEKPEVSPQ